MSALRLSPVDAFRDSERKRTFFVEWRLTDPDLCERFGALQDELKQIGGDQFLILQSCAKDNLHITMNEVVLRNEMEVQIVMKILEDYNSKELRSLIPTGGLPVDCHSIRTFSERVAYIPVWNTGAEALKQIYLELATLFRSGGLKVKMAGGAAEFNPHLTLGKAAPSKNKSGASLLPTAVLRKITTPEYLTYRVGTQQLTEILFCVKRKKEEATPPVLLRMDGQSRVGIADEGASGSAMKKSAEANKMQVTEKKEKERQIGMNSSANMKKKHTPAASDRSKKESTGGDVVASREEVDAQQVQNPFYDKLYKVVHMSTLDEVDHSQHTPEDPFAVGFPY